MRLAKLSRNASNAYFNIVICFLYFAISDLSRMLELLFIPRPITYILYLGIMALYVLNRLHHICLFDFYYYLVITCIILYGIINNYSYLGSIENIASIFILFYPAYLLFRLFDIESLKEGAIRASWFSAVYLLIFYFGVVYGDDDYRMMYAYWISFPACIWVSQYLESRKLIYLIGSGVMLITLVFGGGRGALILTLAYISFMLINNELLSGRKFKRIAFAIITVIVVILVYSNFDTICLVLSEFSGFSRNIKKLLQGKFFQSNGRDRLYNYCETLISDGDVFGYGPLTSRELITFSPYPHSLWYELQLDFGQYIGIVLFIILIYMAVSNIITYRCSSILCVVAYISIVGMGSLMLSSSFYYKYYVPANVALYINMKLLQKRTSS